MSDSEGSLSDASEGMLSDVESDGENQVIELTEFWKHSREPFDNSPNNVDESEFKTPRGSFSIDREQFDDIDLDEFMDENVVRQNYVQDPEEDHELDVFEEPFSMNIIRESATWSQRIRRRLPWSRLSRPRQVEIELELSPIWVISDDDLEEMQLEIPLPEPQLTWWQSMTPAVRQRRFYYIKLLAAYFLIPSSLILMYGLALHKNLETQQLDPLVQLYYNLPTNNWFRQNFSALSWAYIITVSTRPENLLFITYIAQNVENYFEDYYSLWKIANILKSNESLQMFLVLRTSITFRAQNSALVKQVVLSKLFSGFEWCTILENVLPNERQLILGFVDSQAVPTNELNNAVKQAKQDIKKSKKNNFDYLILAMKNILSAFEENKFSTKWTRDMLMYYHNSYFSETFSQVSFENVLYELSTRSDKYPVDAKIYLNEFLHRFVGFALMEKIPEFSTLDKEMKYVEDPSSFILQFLKLINNYKNDQKFDQMAYSLLNHSKPVRKFATFGQCVQALGVENPEQVLQVLSCISHGILGFMKKLEIDLRDEKTAPEELPSTKLYLQGVDPYNTLQNLQIGSNSRHLLSDHQDIDYSIVSASYNFNADLFWVEGPGFYLGVLNNKCIAAIQTLEDTARYFHFIIFNNSKFAVFSKNMSMTMTQNSLSYTGVVLNDKYWVSKEIDLIISIATGVAATVFTDHVMGFDISLPLMAYSGDLMKTALLSYSKLGFKEQILLATGTSFVVYYGPKKIIEKTVELTETVYNNSFGLVAIGALGLGSVFYFANKKQKIF